MYCTLYTNTTIHVHQIQLDTHKCDEPIYFILKFLVTNTTTIQMFFIHL